MNSSSGGVSGSGDKDDGNANAPNSLHDHSDLLIPNPSFLASPASSTSSSVINMNITSPCSSDTDLASQMEVQMVSPQEPMSCEASAAMDFISSINNHNSQPDSSPPNVIVDDSPLQPCMDRNKESLKNKLLMRRSMNQLVEQGILPPPKTPAAFANQRVRLERARMGDLLKAKIQQRPARQELVRQHILEDTDTRVAPRLAEKQRMLKRAKLADSLNDHLIHRPGPLELVQKNILHAPDADIEKAIKEGIVSFKATSEGHVPGPSLPNKYTIINEDDSSSDISSPAGTPDACSSGATTEANTPIPKQLSDSAINNLSPASVPPTPPTLQEQPCEVTLQPAKSNKSESASTTLHQQPSLILTATIPSIAPVQQKLTPTSTTIFQVATPAAVIPPPPPLPPSFAATSVASIPPPPPPLPPQTIVLTDGAVRELLPQLQAGFQLAAAHVQKPSPSQSSSLGKSRSSKKSSKSKSQPKARTIKFHEYKGPSNLQQKGGSSSANSLGTSSGAQTKVETSYELLLKQQQLLLQWQLELQHKYPQIILPAAPKDAQGTATSCSKTMSSFPVATIPASLCTNLINNQQTSSQQPTATIAVATASTNASLKPIPVTLAPKLAEIAPKPPAPTPEVSTSISESKTTPVSGEISSVPSPATSTTSSVSDTSKSNIKPLNLSNINEWKVNDLKAELKKRSLPVSGSKSQLMERLKTAVAKEGSNNEKSSVSVKMEVVTATDENSSEGMDVTFSNNDDNGSGGSNNNKSTAKISQPQSRPPVAVSTPTTVVIGTPSNNTENNNISILDLASGKLNGVQIPLQNILSLLGVSATVSNDGTNGFIFGNNNPAADNNVKNATVTSTATPIVQAAANNTGKIIGQLPISTVVATATKVNESSSNSNNKLIDENKILEQQEQILQLRKALEISQQQLQQLAQQKDPKNGGSQKHRLVLQQHIQQKRHQQAIQNHLQSLIQLQSQQAEQKKQQQLLQQQQAQAQLVLISSNNNNQPVSIANNILPVTIVSPSPQQVSNSPSPAGNTHNWLHQQHNGNSATDKPERQQEVTQTRVEPGANLNFEDLVQTMNTKHVPKLESAGSDSGKASVKSQMVDDVLEILIRNGELPPSAAQDPHTKTPSPPSAPGGDTRNQNHVRGQPIPPPPPLPPQGFSVMLPTSIPFSRHQTTTNTNTSDFLSTFGEADNLSKDAKAILKITEDLTKFGKSREAEAAAAAAANAVSGRFENGTGSSGNLTMMDCGFFNGSSDSKDFDLSSSTADSMDVGFGDAHSVSLHSSSSTGSSSNNKHQSINNLFNNSFDSGAFSFGQHQQPQQQVKAIKCGLHNSGDHHQQQNHFMSDEDLVSLDMQMDTDYSDWLDTFLPAAESSSTTSTHNSGNGMVPNLFPMEHQGKSGKRPDSDSLHNNDNNNISNTNSSDSNGTSNNIFGSFLEDHHQHLNSSLQQGQQRDPLLSSRSFTPSRMTTMTLPFGEVQPNNILFAHQHHLNSSNPGATTALLFHSIPTSSGSSSTATLMDTDFDELTVMPSTGSSCSNTKLIKSENNLILNSANTNVITEMPSTNPTPITTTSINDNFLWDFAM